MTKKRVFSIEGSQTHPVPHVETTMTSLGNFRPALNMSIALPGCSLYLLWYGPSGISPSRSPTTPHLASVTFDALHTTLFRASKIGSSQPLHISLPLHLHRTTEKSVHKRVKHVGCLHYKFFTVWSHPPYNKLKSDYA